MKRRTFNFDVVGQEEDHCFPEIDLQYPVSKDDVWKNLIGQIELPRTKSVGFSIYPYLRIAVAASLFMILGLTGIMKYYTKTIYSPAGQHLSFYLPDSSFIELNAQTKVVYHPYWYKIARTVTLDGEAYFKVTSGNQFKVASQRGETTVLGTSFNIYSRNSEYTVTCFTGKVRVVSNEKSENVLLSPNEQASLKADGIMHFVKNVNALFVKSWRDNMFIFTGASVVSVIQEIERQYNIKIGFRADPGLTYTGNFSKSLTEKDVLDLVCTSLGITFEVKSGNEFLVK